MPPWHRSHLSKQMRKHSETESGIQEVATNRPAIDCEVVSHELLPVAFVVAMGATRTNEEDFP
jgi:hypothetical protein